MDDEKWHSWLEKFGNRIDRNDLTNIEPIPGQLSFFSGDKSSFLKSSEDKIKFYSFDDIIKSNYTVGEMQELHSLSVKMERNDPYV